MRNVLRDYDQNDSSVPKMRETQARSKLGGDVVQYFSLVREFHKADEVIYTKLLKIGPLDNANQEFSLA